MHAYPLRASLVHLYEWMLRLLSTLPSQVHYNASLGALAGVNVHDVVFPRARGGLKFYGLRARRGRLCRVRLASSLRSIGAIRLGAGTASLLAPLGSLLLLFPSGEKSISSANRLKVLV